MSCVRTCDPKLELLSAFLIGSFVSSYLTASLRGVIRRFPPDREPIRRDPRRSTSPVTRDPTGRPRLPSSSTRNDRVPPSIRSFHYRLGRQIDARRGCATTGLQRWVHELRPGGPRVPEVRLGLTRGDRRTIPYPSEVRSLPQNSENSQLQRVERRADNDGRHRRQRLLDCLGI